MQFVNWLVIALLAAALMPSIMDALIDVDTSSWPAIAQTVWDNLPVFIIIGVMFLILRRTGLMSGRGGIGS